MPTSFIQLGVGQQDGSRATATMTDADYTPSAAEYSCRIMEFAGTLSAGRNVIVPAFAGFQWTIYNNTTGGFAITVKTSGGTGIAVAATKRAIVYCDGTNVVRVTADT